MLSGNLSNGKGGGPPGDKAENEAASLIDLMMRQARNELDEIKEPTSADLDELDELDDLVEIEETLAEPAALQPALSLLAQLEEPELVSLESLDDAEPLAVPEEDADEVEELLDDVESLIEDYIDIDLKDEELKDEGYDLDDDDGGSYRDLYGDDDTIVPSFREGEFAEEDESDTAYYDDMR